MCRDRQKDLLVTLFGTPDLDPGDPNYVQGLINVPRNIPMQQVAGSRNLNKMLLL